MTFYNYQNDLLHLEQIAIPDLIQQYGSPLYVYSKNQIVDSWKKYDHALGAHGLICYAVKACSNLSILKLLADLGSGFDIVSLGELERVLAAGGRAEKIVFSGVAKEPYEMKRALEVGIHCFNVESKAELEQLNVVAGEMGVIAPVSIRVNPDVDAKTHPYISTGLKQNKFGIEISQSEAVYELAHNMPNVQVNGVDCHIGSQITELSPFIDAVDRLLSLVDRLKEKGIVIKHLDLGGGIGVQYEATDQVPDLDQYLSLVREKINDRNLSLVLEPGRSIIAKAGAFITRVVYLKSTDEHNFAIVDGGMNDLIRPALYQAWQEVKPVMLKDVAEKKWDVVGPICETGDFLAHDRQLSIEQNDLLAVMDSGAYGFTMSSNYNSRNRVAEVLVDGNVSTLIRHRETIEQQIALELSCLSSK